MVVRRLMVAVAVAVGLTGGMAGVAGATVSPLSPEPTFSLSCVEGQSILEGNWPAGEYGEWSMTNPYFGDVGGAPATYSVPTVTTTVVPAGWYDATSTIRLNNDPVDNETGENQVHVSVTGSACLFDAGIRVSYDCATQSVTVNVTTGRVNSVRLFDASTGVRYAGTGLVYAQPFAPVAVGPFTVPATTSATRVEITVNGIVSSQLVETPFDCARGCVNPRGDWVRRADLWPASITVGGVTYSAEEGRAVLRAASTNPTGRTYTVFQYLMVAKLNAQTGDNVPGLSGYIATVDAWMTAHPLGSTVSSTELTPGLTAARWLDRFNNGRQGVPVCPPDPCCC